MGNVTTWEFGRSGVMRSTHCGAVPVESGLQDQHRDVAHGRRDDRRVGLSDVPHRAFGEQPATLGLELQDVVREVGQVGLGRGQRFSLGGQVRRLLTEHGQPQADTRKADGLGGLSRLSNTVAIPWPSPLAMSPTIMGMSAGSNFSLALITA